VLPATAVRVGVAMGLADTWFEFALDPVALFATTM
jgi:hypothetical protein